MATKDVGLRIRIQRNLRDDFLSACRGQDKPAAQVLREFMRAYVVRRALRDRSLSTDDDSRQNTDAIGGND